MFNIKKINRDSFKEHFEMFLKLKNYSSKIHFVNKDNEIKQFNRHKLEEVYEYLEHGKAIIYGAFDEEGSLVGYVWGYPHIFFDEKRMYINSIVVEKESEGKGIGKRLLKAIEDYAQNNNYDALDLNVLPENNKAYHLYTKEGYKIERYQMKKGIRKNA